MKALRILDELSCGVEPQINLGNWGVFFTDKFLSFQESISELEALQQHIKDLEAQLSNTKQLKEVNIIRKGQSFYDDINGYVIFDGIDYCCGEISAKLRCSDGSVKYPLLASMPEFNFIDN